MQIVRVGGIALHVADDGERSAPAVVFANSLGTDLRVWDAVLPLLPAGLRVIRYDKRGHGLSDSPPGRWRIEDFADDLAGLLDALGVRAAAVVGLSVGGLIAQALAARRPDLVRVLILSGTAAKIGTAEMWNQRIREIEEKGIAAIADGILERWFTARFRASEPSLAAWRNMLVRSPAAGYLATCGAIRDADLTAATAALRLPALAMVGEADGSTPPELVRATAALIAGSRFEIIRDAGHIPGVERPQAVARLIGDFLQETGHA
jgi:3-oxoadipate enol-lactonase